MRAGVLGLVLCAGLASAQPADTSPVADTLAYTAFTTAGDTVALGDIVAAMRDAEVVFLGEIHDDATAHALQLQLLQAADTLDRPVVLGLEIFERDVQPVLDEYLGDLIRERDFLEAARPWSNYAADYRPLVEYAREHGLPVLATNAPGRYVSRVSRLGPGALADLTDAARATLVPLPVPPPSDSLAAKFNALMADMTGHGTTVISDSTATDTTASDTLAAHSAPGVMPTLDNLLAAQNLRDAAMAHAIAEHLDAHPDALAIHINGSFHSEGGYGIPEHIVRYRPGTRALVVTMRPASGDDTALPGDDFVIITETTAR